MIAVQCTACGNQYELSDEDAGTQAQCACGNVLDIPAASGAPAGTAEDSIPIQCPSCASQYELSAADAGTQVQCVCGQVIDVPNSETPAIALQCTGCGAAYEVGVENAGTQMQCPCGEVLTVPDSPGSSVEGAAAAIAVGCPACGSQYEVPATDAGQQVQCPCGEVMVVPDVPMAESGTGPESSSASHDVPDTHAPVKAQADEGTQPDETASESQPAAEPSPGRKKKEASPFFWPAVVLGLLLLCGTGWLFWPDSGSPQTAETGTEEPGSKPDESLSGRAPGPANEWPAWVSNHSLGLVIVRPRQMFESSLAGKVPHDELITAVLSETGVELTDVEEAVFILDPPASGKGTGAPETKNASGVETESEGEKRVQPDEEDTAPAGGEEVVTTAFLRFAGKANRRSLSSSLLPDGEAVTVNGRTIFRGTAGSLFFADSRTVVFSSSVHLRTRLADIVAGRRVTNRLLEKAAGEKPLPGDLLVSFDISRLKDAPLPLPPEFGESLAGVQDAVITLDLSGGVFLKLQLDAGTEEAAKKVEASANRLVSAATTQFSSWKPLLQPELPDDSPLKAVEELINRTRVFRSGSSVTVSTPPPVNLANAVAKSVPLLAPLGEGLLSAGRDPVTTSASGTPSESGASGNAVSSTGGTPASGGIRTKPQLPIPSQEKFRIYEQAFERFGEMYAEAEELKKKIAEAEDKPAARKAWLTKLAEATGLMQQVERLAVRLADLQPDNREKLLQSRYVLAFLYSQLKMHYEAGILGSYVARHDDPKNDRARDSGFIALAAWQAAYADAPPDDRLAEMEAFVEAASLLDSKWPENENLDRVRFVVGQIQQLNSRYEPAAAWYIRVRPEFEDYATAQVYAGQACWKAWRELSRRHRDLLRAPRPETNIDVKSDPAAQDVNATQTETSAEKPPQVSDGGSGSISGSKPSPAEIESQLAALLTKARQHLNTGMTEFQKKELETPPEVYIAGKMSLGEVLLRAGDSAAALAVLRDDPFPLLKAIQVAEGEKRPKKGITSREFAAAVHQLHLRACVSAKDLTSAKEAMLALESLASANDASRLTAIYLQIGRDLAEEIQSAPAERASELRSSFKDFLTTMAEREQQTYGSLLWVAETSTEIAKDVADPGEAREFHARAADAYQAILDNAAVNREFCSANTVAAIRIRLARSSQRAGRFEQALKLLNSLLTLQPNSFTMQTTAALALQEWGTTTDEKERLLEAIQGYGDSIWGWGKLSVTLQRHVTAGTGKPEYADLMRQARYQIALARRDYALAQAGQEKSEQLRIAITEIRTFAQLDSSLSGEWWQKIDEVYQQIQQDLGESPASIQTEFQKNGTTPRESTPETESKDAS